MRNWKRTAKNGITNPKKDWKEWKDTFQEREKMKKTGKRKIFFKRESISFHSRSNKFWTEHISSLNLGRCDPRRISHFNVPRTLYGMR